MPNIEAAKVGDKLAIKERAGDWGRAPHVNYSFFVVGKVTATQVVAVKDGTTYELRFRRVDGVQIGASSPRFATTATMATTELIQAHNEEVAARARYHAATHRIGLVEKAIGRRELSVEQMEAIATAYESTVPQVSA
jgi:hypothetical protein